MIAIIKPTIAANVSLIWKLIISILNPIAPVRFLFNTESTGTILASKVPIADPRTAPIIINAIKKPIFLFSKVIAQYKQPLL